MLHAPFGSPAGLRRLTGLLLAGVMATTAAGPGAAAATGAMTGAEFEAYTTGKTLTYAESGQPYGVERYLPGRRVVWAFVGAECRYGTWYEDDDRICFVYDNDPEAQCWRFQKSAAGLRAHFIGDPDGAPLVEVEEDPEALKCPGPDVGV